MGEVKISIVIPIFNVEKYIEECIRSAMRQTFKDIEIICVNDGSTDGSLEILNKLAAEDDRLKIISKPNSGYGHSINVGMDAAIGKYFAILESDDYIENDMYERLYATIEKHNVDFVKSNFFYLYGKGKSKTVIKSNVFDSDSNYDKVLNPSQQNILTLTKTTTWTGLYNLAFLRKNGIRHNETPGASYQDTGFCFDVYAKAKSCVFIKDAFYYYRQDNAAASMRSKGKVYAITKEYAYIKKNLIEAGLFEQLKGAYTYRKFDAYFNFNYNRIAAEFKKEFLQVIVDEFSEAIKNGEYDENYFNAEEKKTLFAILNNPLRFYFENLNWRIASHQSSLNYVNNEIKLVENSKKYKMGKILSIFSRNK